MLQGTLHRDLRAHTLEDREAGYLDVLEAQAYNFGYQEVEAGKLKAQSLHGQLSETVSKHRTQICVYMV